jgi:hypothetical protein
MAINAEATIKPAGWNYMWNPDNLTVVWGYVSE